MQPSKSMSICTVKFVHILPSSPGCPVPTPGLTSKFSTCSVCVCVYTHTQHVHINSHAQTTRHTKWSEKIKERKRERHRGKIRRKIDRQSERNWRLKTIANFQANKWDCMFAYAIPTGKLTIVLVSIVGQSFFTDVWYLNMIRVPWQCERKLSGSRSRWCSRPRTWIPPCPPWWAPRA